MSTVTRERGRDGGRMRAREGACLVLMTPRKYAAVKKFSYVR